MRELPWPTDSDTLAPPVSLTAMIAAAEELSAPFPFARVDFYEVDGKPRFGEVSFYHNSGETRFDPPEWDEKLGQLWPDGLPTA